MEDCHAVINCIVSFPELLFNPSNNLLCHLQCASIFPIINRLVMAGIPCCYCIIRKGNCCYQSVRNRNVMPFKVSMRIDSECVGEGMIP
jgi:hypothetical protein